MSWLGNAWDDFTSNPLNYAVPAIGLTKGLVTAATGGYDDPSSETPSGPPAASQPPRFHPGSTVDNPGGPATTLSAADQNHAMDVQNRLYYEQQAKDQANHAQQAQGFMANMGWRPQASMFGANPAPMVAAPPPGWAYHPGQGAVWQTPQHTIQAGPDKQSQNWSMHDAPQGVAFAGNRI